TLLLGSAILAGCGGNNDAGNNNTTNNPPAQNEQPAATPTESGAYADGVYLAEGPVPESGWQDIVALKVEGGKITEVNWNAINTEGGLDKKSFDKAGKYGMKAKAGAQADWYEQAEKAEAFLLEKQEIGRAHV